MFMNNYDNLKQNKQWIIVCENAKQATISMLDGFSAIPYSLQGIHKRKVKKNEKCKFVCVGNTIILLLSPAYRCSIHASIS